MDRVDDSASDASPSGPRLTTVLAAILAAAALLCLLWMGSARAVGGGGALAVALALFVLAALLGAGAAGWVSIREQRLAAQLREARESLRRLDEMLDVWQWQTDRQHRLITVRPPLDAKEDAWSMVPAGTALWEHFKADDEAALRARLATSAPFQDVVVRRSGGGDGESDDRPRGRLRGRPRTDAMGRFAGYAGTLRELENPAPAVKPEPVAITAPTPAPAPVTAPAAPAVKPVAGGAESEHESFGYTVSHDLRAPIRVVEGFTKIVKEDYGRLLDRVGNDHLDRVLGAAARMNSMIDALLALSKLSSQPLAHQPVNLSQLAGYVSEDLRRQWPDRNVKIEIEPGLQVRGDPTLLRVVIENLLGNAWKYTGKCAEAHISFERRGDAPDQFTVRDNGAGFDMRFADRLFGVFQRLHSANDFPGTGVGLASVRRIVRRHGGEIWGEAEVNRGARFHFSLPQGERSN